jgi:hypothetical protein
MPAVTEENILINVNAGKKGEVLDKLTDLPVRTDPWENLK